MKPRIVLWFLLILIFALNQLFENFGGRIFFLYSYLDDLLFFPIILTLILIIQQKTFHINYVLSKQSIFFSFIFFSVLTEIIYPNISPRFTYDSFDLIAYALGVMIFYWYFNKDSLFKTINIGNIQKTV